MVLFWTLHPLEFILLRKEMKQISEHPFLRCTWELRSSQVRRRNVLSCGASCRLPFKMCVSVSNLFFSLGGHHFVSLTESDHGRYCSLCENGMQSGMQCDFCGVMVDTRLCLHSLSSTVPCKMVARTTDNDIMHHWVGVFQLITQVAETGGLRLIRNIGN